jgi:NTE family protein
VIYGCKSCDILLIRLTPAHRSELPTSARAILDRMEEISFNAALMREMRVISFMTELIDEGKVSDGKRMFIHSIEAEDIIKNLAASSKMNADWTFLTHLFERGREYADAWLTENFDSIGVETTVDLKAEYF